MSDRVQMTVRIDPADKAMLEAAAKADGIETGVAVRQIIELFMQRLRRGDGYIESLVDLRRALRAGATEKQR